MEIIGENRGGRATQPTGIGDDIQATYKKVKSMIKNVAEDIGDELASIQATARPKQVEMEFNVGISAQAGPVWVLSGTGEYGLKIKMTWELGRNERAS